MKSSAGKINWFRISECLKKSLLENTQSFSIIDWTTLTLVQNWEFCPINCKSLYIRRFHQATA